MKVKPNTNTTLVIDNCWTAIGLITAGHVIRKTITGGYSILNKNFEAIDWDQWLGNDVYFDDQPTLSTINKDIPVPTIVLLKASRKFNIKRTKPTKSLLYKHYNGICQICGVRKPIKEMTFEHVYPRAKGGSNDDFNITLTCKKCNNIKQDVFPYLNFKGQELRGTTFRSNYFKLEVASRKEWESFIHH